MTKKIKASLPAVVDGKKAHATFSASASDRWLNCPGSIALIEKAPPARESEYAKEGTDAHAALEFLVKNRKSPGKAVMFLRTKYPFEMVHHAEASLNFIEQKLATMPGAELHSEIRAELPVSEPDQFGTTDIVIIEHFGRLVIIDYKYGAGIAVYPEENSQLIYYALGVAKKYDYNFADVELIILQPRAQVEGGAARSWVTTIDHLLEWRDKFEAGIQAAKDPFAPLVPGVGEKNHCRFCPAATICPAIGERAMKQAAIDFAPENEIVVPDPKKAVASIAIKNLSKILTACDSIEAYIKAVREHAFHVLERGEKLPGFKLVPKRGSRKYADPDKAAKEARKLFATTAFSDPELLPPAQLEKVKGLDSKQVDKFLEKNVISVSSGLTLVSEDDSRPGVNPAKADFTDVPCGKETTAPKKAKGAFKGKVSPSFR